MKRHTFVAALALCCLCTLGCGLIEEIGSVIETAATPPPDVSEEQPIEPGANLSTKDPVTRPADGATMVQVPAGEFLMGDDQSPFAPERPQHVVALDEYWIDAYEITNAQYRLCVDGGACTEPRAWTNADLSGDQQPVLVFWEGAQAYCTWVGGRLPTEAEWEKAARGPDGRTWPWGNEWQDGWANLSGPEDGYGPTAPVGSFPNDVSPYGLLDVAGNAAEWVADWFDKDYYARSPARNPTGPASGDQRVRRGTISNAGGGPEKCRCAARYATTSNWEIGFRCVFASPPE